MINRNTHPEEKSKASLRQNVKSIIIVAILAAVVLTLHIVRRNATMRGLESHVAVEGACLLTSADVDSLILTHCPTLLDRDIKDVDSKGIAKMLRRHPYVQSAEAKMSMGGKLVVNVIQRTPVLRMFYQDNEYYISRQGTCMPLSAMHYCDIIVGSTECEEPLLRRPTAIMLDDTANHNQPRSLLMLWVVASYISDNPRYQNVFDQVAIGQGGDIYLIPKLGDIAIVLGDTTRLEEKFNNLWAFFNKGINQVGWDAYSRINLKYKDQVVCTRKE